MEKIIDITEDQQNKEIRTSHSRPVVSIVLPAYNEAAMITTSLNKICQYMESIENQYRWELIVVNDGCSDNTGVLAETFAKERNNVHVLHHDTNFNLGQAFRFAFNNSKGDYVIPLDADLSYSPEHVKRLLDKIIETKAKIVIASPYMKGGKISNVPRFRRIMSYWANRFLSLSSLGNIRTLTGMVRAYDRRFLNSLNLKAMDNEINPEIIYKAQLLRARIVEIPAHLDWKHQESLIEQRKSSIKLSRGILSGLFSGFIFRPFMVFIIPGFLLVLISYTRFHGRFCIL